MHLQLVSYGPLTAQQQVTAAPSPGGYRQFAGPELSLQRPFTQCRRALMNFAKKQTNSSTVSVSITTAIEKFVATQLYPWVIIANILHFYV